MGHVVHVSVPASSANLGPGFDCMAAALDLRLELEVESGRSFAVEHDLPFPRDRDNAIVQAFERLRPADDVRFVVRSDVPAAGGMGSSATAIVAGLAAAAALDGGEVTPEALLPLAVDIEGHPDNVAAALHGGVVICDGAAVVRVAPPAGLEAVLVVPHDSVRTATARAVLPPAVPLGEASANVAWAATLAVGLERGDLALVSRSLRDTLHQPHRAALFPRSAALLHSAESLGALGATVSGAGPAVLLWTTEDAASGVAERAGELADDWATVRRTRFVCTGLEVGAPVGPGR